MTGVPGQREQQRVEQLDLAPVVAEQRREPAADAEVDAHLRVRGVGTQHEVALLVGDHLERQLVVVAQERRPLRARPAARGVCSRMSTIGVRCSSRSDMNSRGITGKWKFMWHSSPSPK